MNINFEDITIKELKELHTAYLKGKIGVVQITAEELIVELERESLK